MGGSSGSSSGGSADSSSGAPGRGELGYLLPPIGPSGDALALRTAVEGLVTGMRLAAGDYGGAEFRAMRRRCMARDVSWARSAAEWEAALLALAQQPPKPQTQQPPTE